MRYRRPLPALPLWAMLAAVWALLLLGAAPPAQVDALCGSTSHHHASDCLACCPCTTSGALQALIASPPNLPSPRGAELAAGSPPPPARPAALTPLTARARSPPDA